MDSKRIAAAFGWGVVATIVMSVVMIIGMLTGLSPMPKPVPAAIVSTTFGELERPVMMTLSALSHLIYAASGRQYSLQWSGP